MSVNKTGELIARLRNKKNWTQKEMAETLMVSDKTVSKWENSEGYPDIQFLVPIAYLFGITVDELLSGTLNEELESKSNLEKAVIKGKNTVINLIESLREKSNGIKTRDEYNKTLVDYVIEYKDFELIKYFIECQYIGINRKILNDHKQSKVLLYTTSSDYRRNSSGNYELSEQGRKNIILIYSLLVQNGEIELLKKVNFFDSNVLAFFTEIELTEIFKSTNDEIVNLLINNNLFIDTYIKILAEQKKENQFLNLLNSINKFRIDHKEKVEKAKSENNLVFEKENLYYYISQQTNADYQRYVKKFPEDAYVIGAKPVYVSGLNSVLIVNNLSINASKQFIELSKPGLFEELIKAISERKYQELYSLFSESDISKFNGYIIQCGDYHYIANKVKQQNISLNDLIINQQYDEVIRIATDLYRGKKRFIELRNKYVKMISEGSSYYIGKKDENFEEFKYLFSICVRTPGENFEHPNSPSGMFDYFQHGRCKPFFYDIGLLFKTRNYYLINSLVSLLEDCEKDGLITKYIDGDLIVLKALLDAGACYLCNSVEIIPIEKFNEKYYEKRDMTKTNIYKYTLRDLKVD